jgi:hypothetical protein
MVMSTILSKVKNATLLDITGFTGIFYILLCPFQHGVLRQIYVSLRITLPSVAKKRKIGVRAQAGFAW